MDSSTLVLMELLLVFGAVIAFGVWQLRSVRCAKAEGKTEGSDSAGRPEDRPPAP